MYSKTTTHTHTPPITPPSQLLFPPSLLSTLKRPIQTSQPHATTTPTKHPETMEVAQIVLAIENAETRILKCVKAMESGGIGRNFWADEGAREYKRMEGDSREWRQRRKGI